ncbi:hypothetical protein CP03DC35_1130A, partial [Chlamydia psittaci 03DC35]
MKPIELALLPLLNPLKDPLKPQAPNPMSQG